MNTSSTEREFQALKKVSYIKSCLQLLNNPSCSFWTIHQHQDSSPLLSGDGGPLHHPLLPVQAGLGQLQDSLHLLLPLPLEAGHHDCPGRGAGVILGYSGEGGGGGGWQGWGLRGDNQLNKGLRGWDDFDLMTVIAILTIIPVIRWYLNDNNVKHEEITNMWWWW